MYIWYRDQIMTQLSPVQIRCDYTEFSGDVEDLKLCQLGSEFSLLSFVLTSDLNIPVETLKV